MLNNGLSAGQFQALAKLLRLRNGVGMEAAKMYFVDGIEKPEIVRRLDTTTSVVFDAVKRCEIGIGLAKQVVEK